MCSCLNFWHAISSLLIILILCLIMDSIAALDSSRITNVAALFFSCYYWEQHDYARWVLIHKDYILRIRDSWLFQCDCEKNLYTFSNTFSGVSLKRIFVMLLDSWKIDFRSKCLMQLHYVQYKSTKMTMLKIFQ